MFWGKKKSKRVILIDEKKSFIQMGQTVGNITGITYEEQETPRKKLFNNILNRVQRTRKNIYIEFLNNHMNARHYQKVLNYHLLPVAEEIGRSCVMYQ